MSTCSGARGIEVLRRVRTSWTVVYEIDDTDDTKSRRYVVLREKSKAKKCNCVGVLDQSR